MSKRLLMAGAGDFAREVLWTALEIPPDSREWRDVCFLDDQLDKARALVNRCELNLPVESLAEYVPHVDDLIVCTIGDPAARLTVCQQLEAKGANFTNIIHPGVAIGPKSTLGYGVIVMRFSGLSVNVGIGNFVTINSYSNCGHDVVVEDGCTLSSHCDVTGHAHLERGVFLGSHAAVMPGVRVGAFAKIAAGSVAFRNVKAGTTVIGVPAKPFF